MQGTTAENTALAPQTQWARNRNQDILNDRFLLSVAEGDLQRACRYLGQGADINARGQGNKTALIVAAKTGHVALALFLIEAGANLNQQDRDGATALMYAAANNDVDVTRRLIDNGADITVENKDGCQALYFAFKSNNPDLVELFEKPLKRLLKSIPGLAPKNDGIDAQTAAVSGDTMLTWAARHGQISVIRALIEAGTHIEVRNRSGQTALEIARECGHLDIVQVLENQR